MSLQKCDIVLIPFPFTDLISTKIRPAVIIWVDLEGDDVTLCFISSQNLTNIKEEEFLLEKTHPEFVGTGLKTTSKVRVTKIITVDRSLIKRRLGKLGNNQKQKLNYCLKNAFQL